MLQCNMNVRRNRKFNPNGIVTGRDWRNPSETLKGLLRNVGRARAGESGAAPAPSEFIVRIMNVEAHPTLNADRLAALLATGPFASASARGAALVIGAGDPPRAVYATPAALKTFGAADLDALNATMFAAGSPGARRIRELSRSLPVGGAPRLESLRFFVGRVPVPVGWLCARVAGPDGEPLLLAASLVRAVEPVERVTAAPALEAAPPPDEISPNVAVHENLAPAPERPVAPFTPPPLDGPIRFLWSLDEHGRFAAPDAALLKRLGPHAPLAGESLEALRARVGLDPQGEWERAAALGRSFSGLRMPWPELGGERARVVTLSGAPAFDRDRKPAGIRGFGVFTGEALDLKSVEREAEAPANTDLAPADASHVPGDVEASISDPAGDEVHEHVETPVSEAPTEPTASAPPSVTTDVANAPSGDDPKAIEPAAPPRTLREGGAEIFVLRPPPPPNVVPIRPGALTALTQLPEDPEAPRGGGDSVELSPNERDAFKEIARALGVRTRGPRAENGPPEPPAAVPEASNEPQDAAPPQAPASEPSRHDAAGAASHDDFAALLDQLPIGALVLKSGEALYLNQTLLDLVGFGSLDDFRARDGLKTIFRGRDPEGLTPEGEGGGMPLSTATGEFLTVDAQARPISWRGASAVLIAMRRSREADHQAELRAAELETRRHALAARDNAAALELAADGMIKLDARGHILGMNGAAERLLGYDQKETAGESFLMMLAPVSQPEASAALERLTRSQGLSSEGEALTVTLRDRSGRTLPARLDFGRAMSEDPPEYFVVARDLTASQTREAELRAASAAAETANARKTDFLARVSHEIRTPLHAILGFAEVMMEERFGPIGNERYKDYIKDIHTSGKHVMSLANDLLDLAKIEAGKIELEFAPVDVNKIIRESVSLMQPQAARERIIMRLSLLDKLPNVMADERSLRQIMLNLLSNAVKFNEPGGQVIVSTALDEAGHAVIRVRDTGVGMSESELGVALEPFRRVPGGKRDDGTGLGLPLTKALVEANHADFAIKSRKDHGTLVEVAFANAKAAQ